MVHLWEGGGERPWLRGSEKNTRLAEKARAYADTSSAYRLYGTQDGRAYVCMAVGCDVDVGISFKWTRFKMSFNLSLMKFGTNGTNQVRRHRHKQATPHRVYSSWSLLGSVTKNLTLKLRLWGEPPGERRTTEHGFNSMLRLKLCMNLCFLLISLFFASQLPLLYVSAETNQWSKWFCAHQTNTFRATWCGYTSLA